MEIMTSVASYGLDLSGASMNTPVVDSDLDLFFNFEDSSSTTNVPIGGVQKTFPTNPTTEYQTFEERSNLCQDDEMTQQPSHNYSEFKQQVGVPAGCLESFYPKSVEESMQFECVPDIELVSDYQTPAKPSHDYGQFKQQVAIPLNEAPLETQHPPGFEEDFFCYFADVGTVNSGESADLESLPSTKSSESFGSVLYTIPSKKIENQQECQQIIVDCPSLGLLSQSDIHSQPMRCFPGVHQTAAIARARAQAEGSAKRDQEVCKSSPPSSERSSECVESCESIADIIDQIKSSSSVRLSSEYENEIVSDPLLHLQPVIRVHKGDEEKDEDERFLASEEGKRLSSKERRQLRNKVSARAFRSRRKEYISQLENEVFFQANQVSVLKNKYAQLIAENNRSRNFINLLLKHPGFQPFVDDFSKSNGITPT